MDALYGENFLQEKKTPHSHQIDLFRWRHAGAHSKCTTAALTKTFGCLAAKVHSIQTHSTLCGSHVQSYVKSVRNIVVHALLKTPAEF